MSADKIMEITMQMKTKRNGARQDSKEFFFLFFQSANAKSARGRARKREKLAQKVDHASANVPESFLLFMLIFFCSPTPPQRAEERAQQKGSRVEF
jgi:hypothetical protein